jgi:hypothetical protein
VVDTRYFANEPMSFRHIPPMMMGTSRASLSKRAKLRAMKYVMMSTTPAEVTPATDSADPPAARPRVPNASSPKATNAIDVHAGRRGGGSCVRQGPAGAGADVAPRMPVAAGFGRGRRVSRSSHGV